MSPFFSVIIPSYNQSDFLNQTLNSVLSQTFDDWECLIIDDGSTDNSGAIASEWVVKDKRFRLYTKENGGLSSTRNYGLSKATGQYVQFLDSDDLLHSKKLEEAKLEHEKGYDIVVTSFNMLHTGRSLPPYCTIQQKYLNFDSILMEWDGEFTIPIHCGSFSHRFIGDTAFNENVLAGEDWVFWLTMFKKKPQALFIDQELVSYRFHPKSMSRNVKHMIKNKHIAHQVIYDMLEDEETKRLFFSRFSLEVLRQRDQLTNLYKKNDQRITRRIRNNLRHLRKKLGLP